MRKYLTWILHYLPFTRCPGLHDLNITGTFGRIFKLSYDRTTLTVTVSYYRPGPRLYFFILNSTEHEIPTQ